MEAKTRNPKWLLSLLSAMFVLVAFTACSSTEGNDSAEEPELPQPETPINNDDWQTVPVSGGTIEKDDLSITFPSGTFSQDTKVAITTINKGETAGDNEVSPFYQLTMPLKVDRPITIKIKSEKLSNDVHFLAVEPCFKTSLGKIDKHSITLAAEYNDGGYFLSLPATNDKKIVDDEDTYLTLGLAKNPYSRVAGTRVSSEIQGKVGNIEWYYSVGFWDYRWTMSDECKAFMYQIEPKLNLFITDALKQIQALGFSINATQRQIPFVFYSQVDADDVKAGKTTYATHSQAKKDSWSTIDLYIPNLMKVSDTELKQCIIHELLHYYQADYDPRAGVSKRADEGIMLSEAGAVWVEQFMNNGELNGGFVKDYLPRFLISATDLGAAYQSDNDNIKSSKREQYSRHGYAMSTLLYYLTSPLSGMNSFGIDKTKIVDIYKYWEKNPGTTYLPLKLWLSSYDSGFWGTTQYDEYVMSLLSGKLIKHKNITVGNMAYGEGDIQSFNIKKIDRYETTNRTCYAHGISSTMYNIGYYTRDLSDKSLKDLKVVITLMGEENLHTYIIAEGRTGDSFSEDAEVLYKEINGSAAGGDSLVIKGEELDALFGIGNLRILHAITINHSEEKCDYSVCLELMGKDQQTGGASVSPDQLTYKWEGESQDVIIKKGGYKYCGADVPEEFRKWISVVPYDDGKVSIAVQPNLTFESRDGKVNCWVSNKENPTDEEKKYIQPAVNITQGPVEGVDWSPKGPLNFTAEGGSEKISFEFGIFKRFGAQVHEEGWGWCGVAAANGKLTITVQPNPSSESRECIVDAYVTNSQNPTEEDMVIMPITIFQEGNDGQTAANDLKELWGTWTFTFDASGYYQVYTVTFGKDGSYYYESVDHKHPEDSFTRKGTYKVLDYERWNPTEEGVVGLADIEESFHNSLTGKDVVREMRVRLHNNGYLGYQNYLFTKVE